MLLFRSEQDVDEWCARRGTARGAVFSVETCWQLAEAWSEGRFHPNWQKPDRQATQRLLDSLGLTGDFWALPG